MLYLLSFDSNCLYWCLWFAGLLLINISRWRFCLSGSAFGLNSVTDIDHIARMFWPLLWISHITFRLFFVLFANRHIHIRGGTNWLFECLLELFIRSNSELKRARADISIERVRVQNTDTIGGHYCSNCSEKFAKCLQLKIEYVNWNKTHQQIANVRCESSIFFRIPRWTDHHFFVSVLKGGRLFLNSQLNCKLFISNLRLFIIHYIANKKIR